MTRAPEEPSTRLPPGTQVGEWRVETWQGQGAYGAVYRAVRIGQEGAGPVALKVALYPWDWRMAREAELLSRLSHPSIPGFLGRGVLRRPSGGEHPYFAMEWVEGTPLYAWGEQHAGAGPEVCQVLAQLARALEALHAVGAVHRDVKGDNVLVRLSDRLPVLIDFGSGHFRGAKRLTWQSLPPGTPAYLSAQACLFDLRSVRNRDGYYDPAPADDLFALGVTAYRLVMGQYPPPMKVDQDEDGTWRVWSPDPRPLLESTPPVAPRLREVILRLLSVEPEERGTAAQAAEALEAAAGESVPQRVPEPNPAAQVPPPEVPVATSGGKQPKRLRTQRRVQAWKPGLALAAMAGCVVLLWCMQPTPTPDRYESASTQGAAPAQVPDAGTAGVGDTSPTESRVPTQSPKEKKPIAQETLPELRQGQARPDEKGRCPGRTQVPINGGCWVEHPAMTVESCAENGYVFFKGRCYTHAFAPPKKTLPTSSPAEAR
ncbi:MAG TPA: protein kinase [Myxococcaceae bacterium]